MADADESVSIELASIRHDFPGWRPWLSDSGRWYATRIANVVPLEEPSHHWARTVFGMTADRLRAALRSQEEGVGVTRPTTYSEAAGMSWQEALMRWQELAARDSITTAGPAGIRRACRCRAPRAARTGGSARSVLPAPGAGPAGASSRRHLAAGSRRHRLHDRGGPGRISGMDGRASSDGHH